MVDADTLRLPAEPDAVRSARRFVDRSLRGRGWHRLDRDRARLAVSELVANAVVHAGSEVGLRCRPGPAGEVRLEVTDGAPDAVPDPAAPPEPPFLGGFGLRVVDRISRAWGVERHRGAKTVWCVVEPEVRRGGPARTAAV
jgi:anti-sigma regulatory factor (Ser/Thr protein kinase)